MSNPTVSFEVRLGRRAPRPAATRATPGATSAPVSTAARTLALAHFIEREVRAGRWKSYRDAATALGVSHVRVGHVVGLLMLPAAVQAEVLFGTRQPAERSMRTAATRVDWSPRP